VCGASGSVIDTDIGNGDVDRRIRAPSTDVDGIASNTFAVVRKDLRGIACMMVATSILVLKYRINKIFNQLIN